MKSKIILGIESSCDETSVAVIEKNGDRVRLLSNIISSSIEIQTKYGGIVPEQAAREQLKAIIAVITESLRSAQCKPQDLDAISVTQGPGLIGSLLVGVETAKTLSLIWDKPLIPVNHLIAHFYANWIEIEGQPSFQPPIFPAIGLLVSGGHTDLILMKNHGVYEYLGGTRDDAAGECFDKCARILGIASYPGGVKLAELARGGDPSQITLPKPMLNSGDLDFSFSGLKTAVLNLTQKDPNFNDNLSNIAASIEKSIVDVLVKKTILAVQRNKIEQVMIAGGVAANSQLREILQIELSKAQSRVELSIPPVSLCTDNGAVTAVCALFNFKEVSPLTLQADPNITLRI
ncbi:MAG: tRNA (adenosine(37)-N6)-threonylcarbamoyltransferase complex transferase subunit TsaD [Candidatus Daviesbacteria bacterium]|nr:tRNA (adenosine(37)-N6)-threonylcarbamoyltransferase complex transferase subunit TsaD [Candidatus Daviesbacteria bacterium]